jgi:hypothetical protein
MQVLVVKTRHPNVARAAKYTWQKVPLAERAPKSKMFEDRQYHWCTNHSSWTMYTQADCKGVDYKKGTMSNGNNGNNGNNNTGSGNLPQA